MFATHKIALFLGLGLLTACAPLRERQTAPENATPPSAGTVNPKPAFWDDLNASTVPARERIRAPYRYLRDRRFTDISAFHYFHYAPEGRPVPVGFSLVNQGSAHINPRGLTRSGAIRKYSFFYPDRAKENIHLEITDDVHLSGRFSHDNMFRELHFFPRRQLPGVDLVAAGARLQVTLPTGEPLVFDARSKEILDGVLEEEPIDFNRNRHARANPRVRYQGRYLMITVAQRGEAPRRAKVWGRTKYAEVHYPAKYSQPCRLSPRYIWDQRPRPGDSDPTLTMLHHSDASLFALVEKRCGWDLRELRPTNPGVLAAKGPNRGRRFVPSQDRRLADPGGSVRTNDKD